VHAKEAAALDARPDLLVRDPCPKQLGARHYAVPRARQSGQFLFDSPAWGLHTNP
jgi:hypothetical protein